MIKNGSWLESIIEAFSSLGGKAHRKELAEKVGQIRRDKGLSWEKVGNPIQSIQEEVQRHSSDSIHFGGRKDIFKKTNPDIRDGLWELRDSININETISDIKQEEILKEKVSISEQINNETKYLESAPTTKTTEIRQRNQKAAKDCKIRDNFTCQSCGFYFKDKLVESHHLDPIMNKQEEREIVLSDLVTLCPNCHRIAHVLINQGLENYKNRYILISNIRSIPIETREVV